MLLGINCAIGAELERIQEISLKAGWNSVFLEVQPANVNPEAVFAGTPIDTAASYYEPSRTAQFVSDPNTDLFRETGWSVWYAPDREDSFLTTSFSTYAPRAYLIHSKTDFVWNVTGAVVSDPVQWQPDSFNLVGFCVDRQAPPTYDQFFAASPSHRHDMIYRLVEGHWSRVRDPSAATMRSGEAFWIFCKGSSSYQGPLSISTTLRLGLVFSGQPETLVLRNLTDHPLTPLIEHVQTRVPAVPLSLVIQATDGGQLTGISSMVRHVSVPQPPGDWDLPLPSLEAGKGMGVPMEARLEEMTVYKHSSLLKITTDMGTEHWVPAIALRNDLKQD